MSTKTLTQFNEFTSVQAVGELERQGLFVIGIPEVTKGESYRDAHLRRLLENKRGLNSQNFGGN